MRRHILARMLLFFFAVLLDFSHSAILSENEKLLRINEWHDLDIEQSEDDDGALIDLHLFASCERFQILFMTETDEYTRFRFKFDDVIIRKIDVDSVEQAPVAHAPKVIGSCRETSRKLVRINLKLSNSSIAFRIADQLIRRPYDGPSNDNTSSIPNLRVLIPQNVSCCLIRALYLNNIDRRHFADSANQHLANKTIHRPSTVAMDHLEEIKKETEKMIEDVGLRVTTESTDLATTTVAEMKRVVNKATTIVLNRDTPHSKLPTPNWKLVTIDLKSTTIKETSDQNKWSMYTIGENPMVTTQKPKVVGSWTHAVNKEWSITFLVCSIFISTLMLFLVVFGTFMVFYLMTKPRGGKSPYTIDA